MKAAVTCIFEGEKLSISDALEVRDSSKFSLYLTCISCGKPVRAHKAGKNCAAHFEHHERNYSCPYSEGKAAKDERFGIDDQRAIEGYQKDQEILSGSRNQALVSQCKARDKYTCQACGFNLKLYGRYVIECHHKNPIGIGGVRETCLSDLVSLCPTCHRVSHTRKEPLNVEEIAIEIQRAHLSLR